MARRNQALIQQRNSHAASIPAPVGGWNARDSLAEMPGSDAVNLVNFFPNVSSVDIRGGSEDWATGIPGNVHTVMAYVSGTTSKMFAANDTSSSIYDVTLAGAVGAAVVTGLTNGKWEHTNVTTAGGSYLYTVNGFDPPLLFDGTTWTPITGVSTPAITGVTTTTLANVTLFKNRVWFIQRNTLKAWYLPTSSIGGAANVLDLSSIAQQGGHLVSVATWTIDAGYGVDDNLVFITSNGEVIVYRGTDPASASTFALAGVWQIGSPLGTRCMIKYGGDLAILTLNGLVPMASALQSSRLDPRIALSDKIRGAFSDAAMFYGSSFGWQILFCPMVSGLIINVPVSDIAQEQYVMNTTTQCWARFMGWPAFCWEMLKDMPYYGTAGKVVKAWTDSYQDGTSNIVTNALQAFNYFNARGTVKYFTRARPSLFISGSPDIITVGMNIDFSLEDSATPLAIGTAPPSSLWGTATWGVSVWSSGDLVVSNNWQGVNGIGYCGGVNVRSSSRGVNIKWAATDVVFQTGWAGI